MHVLIIGGGGREHVLAWKISMSPLVDRITCAPGNAGTESLGQNISIVDIDGLLAYAKEESVDLTVVGPEAPLVLGIADRFRAEGLTLFGPSKAAAQLEGSKVFCKNLLRRNNIPSANYAVFEDQDRALAHLNALETYPVVVKADGLAAGKGVIICKTRKKAREAVDAIMGQRKFGDAGDKVIVEDFLEGEEASILALTDGQTIITLPTSQDHKQVLDGDRGPNTGGMGAYSPAPVITSSLQERIERDIIIPTIHGLRREGIKYSGVLYAGIMVTKSGPKVLEYNVRFGDPEAQPVFLNIDGDLVPLLKAVAEGTLDQVDYRTRPGYSVCVVMASGGYPQAYEKGYPITGIEEAEKVEGVWVFHAGTKNQDGTIVTSGGRVLGVTARADTLAQAKERAYEAVDRIEFRDAYFRKDISDKGIEKIRKSPRKA